MRDIGALRTLMETTPALAEEFTIGALPDVDTESAEEGFGIMVAGLPFGDSTFVQGKLKAKTDAVLEDNEKIADFLRSVSGQGLVPITIFCCQSLLQYEMQNLAPEVLRPHLRRLDASLLKMLDPATGLTCLRGDDVDELLLRRARMPVRFKGLGLRSQEWIAPAAFVGGFLHSITAIAGEKRPDGSVCEGMNAPVAAWLTGPEPFDNATLESRESRLDYFANTSASSLATTIKECWAEMRQRVNNPTLDRNDPSPLDYSVEAAGNLGEALMTEKFQRGFTQQMERVASRRLHADFRALPPDDRRRLAYAQADSFSRQFVCSLPMEDTFTQHPRGRPGDRGR